MFALQLSETNLAWSTCQLLSTVVLHVKMVENWARYAKQCKKDAKGSKYWKIDYDHPSFISEYLSGEKKT